MYISRELLAEMDREQSPDINNLKIRLSELLQRRAGLEKSKKGVYSREYALITDDIYAIRNRLVYLGVKGI